MSQPRTTIAKDTHRFGYVSCPTFLGSPTLCAQCSTVPLNATTTTTTAVLVATTDHNDKGRIECKCRLTGGRLCRHNLVSSNFPPSWFFSLCSTSCFLSMFCRLIFTGGFFKGLKQLLNLNSIHDFWLEEAIR